MPATSQPLRLVRDKYIKQWSTHAYKMEYNGYFSNHLLHGLCALSELGAPESQIDAFADRYVAKLCAVKDRVREEEAPAVQLMDAPALLGKRENFEGLRAMYAAEIQHITADGAVREHLPKLVGGLAGALLHGIIQLGYGYHIGGDLLVAEGLAYLHFSHLSFEDKEGEEEDNVLAQDASHEKPQLTRHAALTLARSVQQDPSLLKQLSTHMTTTPALRNATQGELQRRLMAFSSDPQRGNPVLFTAVKNAVNAFDFSAMDGRTALDFSVWLYNIAPTNDFVLLHATTSAWSLHQVEHLLSVDDRVRAWKVWFRMALSAFIMHDVPLLPANDPCDQLREQELLALPPWDEIVAKTLALEGDVDEHVYKLVQVAHDVAMRSHSGSSGGGVTNPTEELRGSPFLTPTERDFVTRSAALKISAVLGRQEKDFLAAYRAHMYNVQKELHELREKMHRNETVENKTEKIKKIEEERDWYRKEALRLDAFTTSMTKDLKYMREKLEAIEEDRNWLEKQLKACKKQNKLLRAELDVRVSSGAPSNAFDISQLPSFDSPKANGSRRFITKKSFEDHEETTSFRQASLPALSAEPTVSPTTSSLVEEREEKFRKQIRGLKKELLQKTQEIGALRRQRLVANDHEARSHLENFFLQCVESVKVEVTRRKGNAVGHDKKDRSRGVHRTPMPSLADKMRNQKQDVGIEFEDFSGADRVRVIERLLAHDEVLTLLYEQLFPSEPRAPQGMSSQRPASTDGDGGRGSGGSAGIQMHPSDSAKSLPNAAVSPVTRKVSFEPTDPTRATNQPAGSGAAAVSAVRGGSGLAIDDSTRDYLRSMRLGAS